MSNSKKIKPYTTKQTLILFLSILTAIILLIIIVSASEIGAFDDENKEVSRVNTAKSDLALSASSFEYSSCEPTADESIEDSQETSEWSPLNEDVEAIAKTLYGECRGVSSDMEKAAVVWCILNRVDSTQYPNTIQGVITQPNQFAGYNSDYPIIGTLKEIAYEVLVRWHNENEGETDTGRVLPKGYIFFVGDGTHNYFTEEFLGKNYWNWSCENPYED